MRTKIKKVIAGTLAVASLATSLTGCGGASIIREDVTKYNLPAALTINELKEYYKRSMDFDSIITRNIEVHEEKYELQEVPRPEGSRKEREDNNKLTTYDKVGDLTRGALSILESMGYEDTPLFSRMLNNDSYHYLKAFLNDKHITYKGITKMQEALGFYFVDVDFEVGPRDVGEVTGAASLLGINGAFRRDFYTNEDSIDSDYIKMAIGKLNEEYAKDIVTYKDRKATYNPATNRVSTSKDISTDMSIDFTDTTALDYSNQDAADTTTQTTTGTETIPDNETPMTGPEGTDAVDTNGTEGTENNDQGQTDATQQDDNFSTQGTIVGIQDGDAMMNIQNPGIDISEWHKIVGSSTEMTAYMPRLDLVFTLPAQEPTQDDTYIIGGAGILPIGIGGLKRFGFNRANLTGNLTLRFVYKEDLDSPGDFLNTNVYIKSYQVETGISYNKDEEMATFLDDQFNTLIDDADRAIVNCDMTALMSGKIFADMRTAILRGYENDHTNLLRQISTVRRVIKRNVPMNTYVLEVETLRQEGSKGANSLATYMDTSYVAVEQDNSNFIITDWQLINRTLQKEPDIEPDSLRLKRLIALNLSGDIEDGTKAEVEELLNDLYLSSTYRILNGEKDVVSSTGENIHLNRGMYDCFNPNAEILSSSDKESINSGLRSRLIKYGTNVGAQLNGTVYSWIGGTEKQVEFLTEELITYTGRDDGLYMNCYYMASNMEGKWVIDDLQVIEEQEVKGDELKTYRDRLAAN